jgi:hypothetical protein
VEKSADLEEIKKLGKIDLSASPEAQAGKSEEEQGAEKKPEQQSDKKQHGEAKGNA